MKSVSMGSFQYKNQVNGEFFAYLWVILLYFSTESGLISGILEKQRNSQINFIRRFKHVNNTEYIKDALEIPLKKKKKKLER